MILFKNIRGCLSLVWGVHISSGMLWGLCLFSLLFSSFILLLWISTKHYLTCGALSCLFAWCYISPLFAVLSADDRELECSIISWSERQDKPWTSCQCWHRELDNNTNTHINTDNLASPLHLTCILELETWNHTGTGRKSLWRLVLKCNIF